MSEVIVGPTPVAAKHLTRSNFEPFGHVIEAPATICDPSTHLQPTSANQGTALKYSEMSPLINNYSQATNEPLSKPTMSLFVCSPRPLQSVTTVTQAQLGGVSMIQGILKLSILERHPYTTQTFIPLGVDPEDNRTTYLIVVAGTIVGPSLNAGMPDVSKIHAFIARGSQAVTYGVGTWHAPMMVIGEKVINFVVTQHTNGIPDDDCEEFGLTDSCAGGISIAVPYLGALPLWQSSQISEAQ